MDEFAGIPLPKGNIKEKVDANVKWLESLSPEKQKKYEQYFWVFVVGFMLIIAFCGGFFVGFERQCSYLVGQTMDACNDYMCENYNNCLNIVEWEYLERKNVSIPFITK